MIEKEVFNYIEYILYNYIEIKKSGQLLESKIIDAKNRPDINSAIRSGTFTSPTEKKAICLVDNKELETKKRIVTAVERTLQRLTEDEKEIYREKYIKKKSNRRIMNDLYISRATFFRRRKNIVIKLGKELGITNMVKD